MTAKPKKQLLKGQRNHKRMLSQVAGVFSGRDIFVHVINIF